MTIDDTRAESFLHVYHRALRCCRRRQQATPATFWPRPLWWPAWPFRTSPVPRWQWYACTLAPYGGSPITQIRLSRTA